MKLILGFGPSALILSHYYKDYKVIGMPRAAMLESSVPFIMWYTKETEKFMLDLDISKEPKKFKVAYYYKDKIQYKLTKEIQDNYSMKIHNRIVPNVLCAGRADELYGWDLRMLPVFEKLIQRLSRRFMAGFIDEISFEKNRVFFKSPAGRSACQIDFPILNTIPLPSLLNTLGDQAKYKGPENFAYITANEYIIDNLNPKLQGDYDFMYVADQDQAIHRVTKINDKSWSIETMFDLDYPLKAKHERICTDHNCLDLFSKKIINFGRYSQWSHNVRMSDVIKRAANYEK